MSLVYYCILKGNGKSCRGNGPIPLPILPPTHNNDISYLLQCHWLQLLQPSWLKPCVQPDAAGRWVVDAGRRKNPGIASSGTAWSGSSRLEGRKAKIHTAAEENVGGPVFTSRLFLLNSQWRLNLTVFSPPASQLAAPQHTAILFSFSTTTDVDSAWCGRQGGGGLRGGASNHMIFKLISLFALVVPHASCILRVACSVCR